MIGLYYVVVFSIGFVAMLLALLLNEDDEVEA